MLASALIVFREVFEAGLVLGIVLSATRGLAGRAGWVAGGVLAGLLGACVVAAFAGAIGDALQGSGQEVFSLPKRIGLRRIGGGALTRHARLAGALSLVLWTGVIATATANHEERPLVRGRSISRPSPHPASVHVE